MSARAQSARGYKLRPAPRRRARGRPASRIHWDKLGRVVLVIVLFVIMLSYINPAANFIDSWRDSRAQQGELQDLRGENARLRAQAVAMEKRDAAAQSARSGGMIAPGELPYVVRGLPK
jgi:cell division protein FtsB